MLSIDIDLAARLVAEQFPRWANLSRRAVDVQGWDNASFRLGDYMVVRLPTAAEYAAQPLKEHHWLPVLGPHLPLEIPEPIALGHPSGAYPWHWSIRRWIDGQPAIPGRVQNPSKAAKAVAGFLKALQAIPARDGPPAGEHSFHRGGALMVYNDQVRAAVGRLKGRIDGAVAMRVWDDAVATHWGRAPVWVHGDISAGNLLARNGELVAVIDFGQLAVGDPACDLAIAWTLFCGDSRRVFRSALDLDDETWARGRAWALWKALIVVSGLAQTNAIESAQSERTLDAVLRDDA